MPFQPTLTRWPSCLCADCIWPAPNPRPEPVVSSSSPMSCSSAMETSQREKVNRTITHLCRFGLWVLYVLSLAIDYRLFVLPSVDVLLAFYENRLKDHYVITPHVLKGMKALVSLSLSSLMLSLTGMLDRNANIVKRELTDKSKSGLFLTNILKYPLRQNAQCCRLGLRCPFWNHSSRTFMCRWAHPTCPVKSPK